MLNKTYWKAGTSYTNGLLLPTQKNVYQNTAIIPGEPIDKSIATSWYKTKFSTLSRNDRSQTTKHEIKDYNVFSVFSTLSGNTIVSYDYMGSSVRSGGSGWDITKFICGIDTSVINVFVPVILYSSTMPTRTVNAINFINNFNDFKDYDYAILGRPVTNSTYGATEFTIHFIIESEECGAILQFSGIDNFTSVSNHQWIGGNICQPNLTGSNTATYRYAESTQIMINQDYPRTWIMPYASEELEDGEDFNAYAKFLSSFEKYVVVEQYSGVERAAWSPDVIYELIRHIGIPLRDTTTVTSETKVYIPMVDENGYHSGEWVLSTDKKAKESSLYKVQTDTNTIDPTKPPTPGGDDDYPDDPWDRINFGPGGGNLGVFAKFYLCTETDLINLRSWFAGGGSETIPTGFDPMPQIIGLSQFATPVSSTAIDEAEITFRAANNAPVHTNVFCQRGSGRDLTLDLGSITIPLRMQDRGVPFLDYSSIVELYIPFCGVFQLDPQTVLGRTIAVRMWASTSTGDCFAIATADGAPVAYGSGIINVDMPISSSGWGVYKAAKLNNSLKIWDKSISGVGSAISTGVNTSIAEGAARAGTEAAALAAGFGGVEFAGSALLNPAITVGATLATAAGGAITTGIQNSVLKHSSMTSVSGSFGSTAAWHSPFNAYIKITRPRFKKPENYGHTVGIPLVTTKKISECSGLTICINTDLSSVSATEIEKGMIATFLNNGVIV